MVSGFRVEGFSNYLYYLGGGSFSIATVFSSVHAPAPVFARIGRAYD